MKQHWTKLHPDRIKRGTEAAGAKLSEEEIEEIVYLHTQCGSTQTWLARHFGVSRITVWRHVQAHKATLQNCSADVKT